MSEAVELIEEPVIPAPRLSASAYPKPAKPVGRVASGLLIQFLALWGPMAAAWAFGVTPSGDPVAGAVSAIGLPAAAIGCALCADFAQRCFFEDEEKSARPRAVAAFSGMGWAVMAWFCAFALGRAM